MKTKVLLLLVALLAQFTAPGQIEQGNWFVNGLNLVNFQTGKVKYTSGNNESESDFSIFAVGPLLLSENLITGSLPAINYAITDQLSAGISLLMVSASMNDEDDDKYTSTIVMTGPGLRVYLMKENRFNPYAEAKVVFGNYTDKWGSSDKDKTTLSGQYAGIGATWFVLPKAGFEFSLGYQRFKSKEKDTSYDFEGTNSGISFGAGILLGF
jgi:hypothetical protein